MLLHNADDQLEVRVRQKTVVYVAEMLGFDLSQNNSDSPQVRSLLYFLLLVFHLVLLLLLFFSFFFLSLFFSSSSPFVASLFPLIFVQTGVKI